MLPRLSDSIYAGIAIRKCATMVASIRHIIAAGSLLASVDASVALHMPWRRLARYTACLLVDLLSCLLAEIPISVPYTLMSPEGSSVGPVCIQHMQMRCHSLCPACLHVCDAKVHDALERRGQLPGFLSLLSLPVLPFASYFGTLS
jgi:hypothetical protein